MTSIDSVLIACSFEEQTPSKIRVSLRSKSAKLDVSTIAASFDGGGHAKAAGIIFEDSSIAEAKRR